MAWDFATDPEFQSQLEWAEAFIRDDVFALESLLSELTFDQIDKAIEQLRGPVRRSGPGQRTCLRSSAAAVTARSSLGCSTSSWG
jgi:hypothetical protein